MNEKNSLLFFFFFFFFFFFSLFFNYVDGQFIQYIATGGPCNFELPFKTVEIGANYPMNENAVGKTEKKFQEELALGYVGIRGEEMKVYRETKQGAIPKSRKDRQKKAEGGEYNCRTISDFSAPGTDGISINEVAGSFKNLDLPQGDRIHANLWEVHDYCVANGLDPKGIRGVKIDIKAAPIRCVGTGVPSRGETRVPQALAIRSQCFSV